ncbi:MAG TPA: hypothetical protein VNE71_04045 [Myxococcota bacterium]|nr:hypothetical protein [Myxococcota bacterium]
MMTEALFRRAQLLAAVLFVLAVAGIVARDLLVSPDVALLSHRDAPWIMAATPLQTDGIAVELDRPPTAFFARPFAAGAAARPVVLHVRALREVELFLNDRPLPLAPAEPASWRRARTLDLRPHLAAGENVIAARVRNPVGPPALQVWIEGLAERVETDASWVAAWEGDPVAYAVVAEGSVRHPEADALPLPLPALAARAPALLATALAGALLFVALRRLPRRAEERAPAVALALVALVYALVLRNVLAYPAGVGFDAAAHLEYIQWIAAHRALPHPRDGSLMYHPPLYHAASALLFGALRPTGLSEHALALVLPLLSGIGMAWVAGAVMRALAPAEPWLEASAVVAAGLLPMNLTIASNVSNEGPAAFFTSLAFLAAVRALVRPHAAPRDDLLLGAALGAALATKYSALLWVPILIGAVGAKRLAVEGSGLARAAAGAAIAAAIAAAIGGWVYARNWAIAGDALVWSLNAEPGRTWFQLPGFRTFDYFTRFGDALAAPWFASFHSFWDSLYTTLWGDGLLSGARSPRSATVRWDAEAMAAGFALALPATAFVAAGFAAVLRASFRGAHLGRRVAGTLLVAMPVLLLCTLASAILRYPFWSGPKAFYALALTPILGVLGVRGFAALAARAPLAVRVLLYGWAAAFFGAVVRSYAG